MSVQLLLRFILNINVYLSFPSQGPNDPMQKMKKQLAEKEKALADELEASKAFKAKVQELR